MTRGTCLPAVSAILTVLALFSTGVAQAQCDAVIDLGRGPVNFHVPASYDSARPAPLVVLLHGYSSTGAFQEAYMGFTPMADQLGYLLAYPDGTRDFFNLQFWNGTDACCDLFGTGVDDSGYLLDLVEAIEAQCNVDPRKIYFTGHSNGGFMSYRMACDHADRVAAIASLAGATWFDPAECVPTEPVHTLQIHGTSDGTIFYNGGNISGNLYPGALQTTETWAGYNLCSASSVLSPIGLNLDSDLPGAETSQLRYTDACLSGGAAELWTIDQGPHVPALNANYAELVSEYLLAHPKTGQCAGTEAVLSNGCSATGRMVMRLRGGLASDGLRVELESGETDYGVLNGSGRAAVRFRGLPDGAGTAKVTFGCGEVQTISYTCG